MPFLLSDLHDVRYSRISINLLHILKNGKKHALQISELYICYQTKCDYVRVLKLVGIRTVT